MGFRNINYCIIFLAMLLICSCKTQKSSPPYGSGTPYKNTDTSYYNNKQNFTTNPSAEINKEEETHKNLQKTDTTKKAKIKSHRKKIIPKINLCGLCQGFVLAKKARQIIQPPKAKGCFAGIAILTWVIILPVLIIIAAVTYFIAILTIIATILLASAVLTLIALLILLGLGALTWFSGIMAIIGATIVASLLLCWFCKKCK